MRCDGGVALRGRRSSRPGWLSSPFYGCGLGRQWSRRRLRWNVRLEVRTRIRLGLKSRHLSLQMSRFVLWLQVGWGLPLSHGCTKHVLVRIVIGEASASRHGLRRQNRRLFN